jgi:signal transduction histidine kinase
VARSGDEIRREMDCLLTGAESNLVAYWRLDEALGDTAADASGHGHTAMLANGPRWVAASAPISQRPAAHSLQFSALSPRSVVMHGAVCPNGFPTTAWFEYGSDSRFGHRTAPTDLGSGAAGLILSNVLSDLTPDAAHHFRMVCTNIMGRADGEELTVHTPPTTFLGFTVARWRFAAVFSGVVAVLVAVAVRYFYVRNFRRTLEHLRQQQALEQERTRIARDLHDDLGSAVTQIKLLGELIERDAARPETIARHGRQISNTSRELARHMDEFVWVVNPQKDHLENLVTYLADFSQEFLAMTPIRCRFDFPEQVPEVPLSGQLRHRLFLAFKEALNNVVRHAQATEVRVKLRLGEGHLLLSVEDNGRGFEPRKQKAEAGNGLGGNGLSNIRERLSEIGGTCRIESQTGAGTKVEMRVNLPWDDGTP